VDADLNESSFPKEMTEKNGIYYKGVDVNGHPIREFIINPSDSIKNLTFELGSGNISDLESKLPLNVNT